MAGCHPRDSNGNGGEPLEDRSAAIDIPTKESPAHGCCCCRCNCRCKDCNRHTRIHITDSNRAEYPGEGTKHVEAPIVPQSVSYATAPSVASVKEISQAPIPGSAAIANFSPPSFDQLRSQNHVDDSQIHQEQVAKWLESSIDEDDEHPWEYFVEHSPESLSLSNVLTGMFGPIELEGSMENNVNSNEQSMLSSLMSSIRTPSVGANSEMLREVGAGFGFLPLL